MIRANGLGRPPVFSDIVEQHFDELDWLWEHRCANLFTPDWTLADLAEHEARAEAHLDALRIAGLNAVDLALTGLAEGEGFAAAASAFVLLDAGPDHHAPVADALIEGSENALEGVRQAARHRSLPPLHETLRQLSDAPDLVRVAVATDLLAFHREPLEDVSRLLSATQPDIVAIGFESGGRTGSLTPTDLGNGFEHPDESVRRAALEAAARMGVKSVLEWCRRVTQSEVAGDGEAVRFLGVLGAVEDLEHLNGALERTTFATDAIRAMGSLGHTQSIPTLIALTSDEELGPEALMAYQQITGADGLTATEGEVDDPEPTGAAPDPDQVAADWARREGDLDPSSRWHRGIELRDDRPPPFENLPLEGRREVYLRLRSRFGTRIPDVELEALAPTQAAQWARLDRGAG